MRFGLAVALMNDGFATYDFGDVAPPVAWWYDDYDFYLGYPLGPAVQISSNQSTNLLTNGGFESSFCGNWTLIVNTTPAKATMNVDTAIVAEGAAAAHVSVSSAGALWNVQLLQRNIALLAGGLYRVQFWARANSPGF